MIATKGFTKTRGVTLVELLITVLIIAILSAWSVPSFQNMIRQHRLTAAANSVVLSVQKARASAATLNTPVLWCGTNNPGGTLGEACDDANTTLGGASFRLHDGNASRVGADAVGDHQIVVAAQRPAILFDTLGVGRPGSDPDGAPYSGELMDICLTSTDTDNHRIIRLVTGSVVTVSTESGACSAAEEGP